MQSNGLFIIDKTVILYFLMNIFIQFVSIYLLEENSIYLIISINFIFILILINKIFIKEIIVSLLLLNLVFLIFFNNVFHYYLLPILVQDLPLFLILISAILIFLSRSSNFSFKISYLNKPVLFFTFYIIFMAVWGIINDNNIITEVYYELHHALYYSFAIILSYVLNKESTFLKLFKLIGIIFFIIALEFIFYNVTTTNRVVYFQAYISPLILSVLLSLILFYKKKLTYSFVFVIILIGTSLTLTRTLWLATIISLAILCYIYFIYSNKISKLKLNFLSILSIIVIAIVILNITPKKQSRVDPSDTEYRAQSVAAPTSDEAFIMRLELGYYVFQKILDAPIIGSGFGTWVNYRFTGDPEGDVIYPDNSWLYFLWKGGIIGFLLFGWIYLRMLKSSFLLFKESKNRLTKAISIGIFAGIMGLIPFGLFNAVLIKYKTTVLFGILIAYLDFQMSQNKIKN